MLFKYKHYETAFFFTFGEFTADDEHHRHLVNLNHDIRKEKLLAMERHKNSTFSRWLLADSSLLQVKLIAQVYVVSFHAQTQLAQHSFVLFTLRVVDLLSRSIRKVIHKRQVKLAFRLPNLCYLQLAQGILLHDTGSLSDEHIIVYFCEVAQAKVERSV